MVVGVGAEEGTRMNRRENPGADRPQAEWFRLIRS
jgi:hypothetical protein